jgi:hypothetical protein
MNDFVYRVHPAINIGRVGNSEEYLISPETPAGLPVAGSGETVGGLPIRPADGQTITSRDIRDRNGALKRQAARFRIYQYPRLAGPETYPYGGDAESPEGGGEGTEIVIGSKVGDRTVTDIVWTVHLANKKANGYVLENPSLAPDEQIIDGYDDGMTPPLRNLALGNDPDNARRLRQLVIDPGPRTISGRAREVVRFDRRTLASYWNGSQRKELPSYPKSYPDDSFPELYTPQGRIDTLGELRTDGEGRLHAIAAYGRACAFTGTTPLLQAVDNDGWFDDTGDGPVSAVLIFDDGSVQDVHGAWVVMTDPSYAPQTLNVISLWDDIYDSWVRKLGLAPQVFDGRFLADPKPPKKPYKPFFEDQLLPIFRAAALQRWNTNLPKMAVQAHDAVGRIGAHDDPADTILSGLGFIRNPNNRSEDNVGPPLMPLSLGDQGRAFMSVTLTQYFFLKQWDRGREGFRPGAVNLGPGEYLDRAVLTCCLGGRFSPGIDMTFIVRQPELYVTDWRASGSGPFRIRPRKLDYESAQASQPFLSSGWIPLREGSGEGAEPGDTSKFMALPWHTDYNSCAMHPTSPNTSPPGQINAPTLYWSWPAQRPVAVYVADEVRLDREGGPVLGPQRFSVRGFGTESTNPAVQGRYQHYIDFVRNWFRVGTVIQGTAIDPGAGGPFPADLFLEVESRMDPPNPPPWPNNQVGPIPPYEAL